MKRTKPAPLSAIGLAALVAISMTVQPSPSMAQSACVGEAAGGTRALLKQAIVCQRETAKATSALAKKTAENSAALAGLAKDLAALKTDVKAVRDDVRQLGGSMATVEVVMGKTIESLAQPPQKPDLSGVTRVLGQRFDALAARVEKLLAEKPAAMPSN